jgi:asparagine synthase (glutamine-hydrolysing)
VTARYIAILASPSHADRELLSPAVLDHLAKVGLECIGRWEGMTIYADTELVATRLASGRGVILGTVFDRTAAMEHRDRFTPAEEAMILASRGRWLIGACWGAYVACLSTDGEGVDIVRAPLGALPCYYCGYAGATIVTNEVPLLVAAGFLTPSINWDILAAQLLTGPMRPARTALAGVEELGGGMRLRVRSDRVAIDELWSPWLFAQSPSTLGDGALAIALADTINACTARLAGRHRHALLSLSGGLDSSIVAAALARSGSSFSCLTLVTDDASGDERHYASLVADRIGAPLIARRRTIAGVEVTRSHAAHLPRPVARSFSQESDRILQDVAQSEGADVYFSGAGGDNVFGFQNSVAPLADRLRVEGFTRGSWRTATDLAAMTQVSALTILRSAIWRACGRDSAYRLRLDDSLLTHDAVARGRACLHHPWLAAPAGAGPAQANGIAMLLFAQNYLEGYARERVAPNLAPLVSQPIVELCLSIANWRWYRHGFNRVVARDAFRADLPAAIIDRRSKGAPDSFVVALLEANYAIIREMLMNGRLVANGLVDRNQLEPALQRSAIFRGSNYWRLMACVDLEAWLSAWMGGPISA